MKRTLACVTAALLLLGAVASAQGKPAPALHVDGKWIKDSAGNPVTLRGVALAELDAIFKGERSQRKKMSVTDIMDIGCSEGWNVDVFRLTVQPDVTDETGSQGWLHYDPADYFERILNPAVLYAVSKGKYVIIDWHYVGADWSDPGVIAATERFWLGEGSWPGTAALYADNPNVLFELFNEPGAGSWAGWKAQAAKWIGGIRAKGANNIVIVGGARWAQAMPARASDLIPGPNIAYACHIYPQHVAWSVPDWMEYVSGVAPVIVTEWGFEKNAPNPENGTASEYGKKFKAYIDSKPNVGWTAWCFDSVYRPVMFDTGWTLLGYGKSAAADRFSGGPEDTADNYMGRFVKEWLAERAR